MKATRILPLIVLLTTFLSTNVFAQRGYVERAIKKNYERKYADPNKQKGEDWFNNHLLNVKIEPQYKFSQSVKMKTTNYKNGQPKSELESEYYFSPGKDVFGFTTEGNQSKKKSDHNTFSIFDYKTKAMIMLDEDKKEGVAINMNAFRSAEDIENGGKNKGKSKSTVDCKKSGKTKTILGQKCFQMVCVDDDRQTRTEIWISTAGNDMYQKAFAMGMTKGNTGMAEFMNKGYVMEMTHYKVDQIESKMEVIDINKSANKTIDTKNYKFTTSVSFD